MSKDTTYIDVLSELDNRRSGHRILRFALLPYAAPMSPETVMARSWVPFSKLSSDPPVYSVDYQRHRRFGDSVVTQVHTAYLAFCPNCVVVTALAHSTTFEKIVAWLLTQHYPYLGRGYWSTQNIFGLLRSNELFELRDLKAVRLSYANVIHGHISGEDNEAHVIWTNLPVDEARLELASKGAWLRRVDFQGYATELTGRFEGKANLLKASIARDGTMGVMSGAVPFWHSIVLPAAIQAGERKQVFSTRGREENPTDQVRPLYISYDTEVFSDLASIRSLGRVLASFPDAGVSIYHGNPYMHAGIVDYLDGSTCEVWVTEPSRIMIIPGLRSTASSLERLAGFMTDTFVEGQVDGA